MSQEVDVTPQTKMYVLLEHTKSSAQVFLQVSKTQRVKIEEKPVDHAFNQITFMDRDGRNRTIRLKLNCDEIYQDKQIKEYLIPANEKWTPQERDAVKFKYGTLVTNNPTVQKFLETSPQFDKFWDPNEDPEVKAGKREKGRVGSCVHVKRPKYTLYDENVKLDEENKEFMLRLAAANKIAGIKDLKEAQELMIKLNGSFFTPPDKLSKCTAELIRFLDSATPAMLDKLLSNEVSLDEQVTILIGKALNYGIISFDHVTDQVVELLPNKKVRNLKEISSEYSPEDRKRYFSEFLTEKDGKLLKEDLEKKVADKEKKKK